MQFNWDEKKTRANVRKYGVSLDEALSVFFEPFAATIPDPDHSEGEHRFIAIGHAVRERLVVVAHTDKDDVIRIISS